MNKVHQAEHSHYE